MVAGLAKAQAAAAPVAVITFSPDTGGAGLPVSFDTSGSRSAEPLAMIGQSCGDFDNDGVLDL